jgi:hypothetical protein
LVLVDPSGREGDEPVLERAISNVLDPYGYYDWRYPSTRGVARQTEDRETLQVVSTFYFEPGAKQPSYVLDPATNDWLTTQLVVVEGEAPKKRSWFDKALDFDRGLFESLEGLGESAVKRAANPIGAFIDDVNLITHPVQAVKAIGNAAESRVSDLWSGDLKAWGKTTGDVGVLFVPGGEGARRKLRGETPPSSRPSPAMRWTSIAAVADKASLSTTSWGRQDFRRTSPRWSSAFAGENFSREGRGS